MKYIGQWSDYEGMLAEWATYSPEHGVANYKLKAPVPLETEVLFASYGGDGYSADATVIFRTNGKLYEVNGSHCSCYGLEGQWGPEETTVEALAMRGKKDGDRDYYFLYEHESEAYEAYWALVGELQNDKK